MIRRVVTCQGSIQLVTALAVINRRESEARGSDYEYENYLVIYDLYAPPGQVDRFADFIKHMASLDREWKAVVYVGPEQIHALSAGLNSSGPARAFEQVYGLVGARTADEIYLCRNWQFGNQLMINAYRRAKKICYGDSIGIYFSEAYFSSAPVSEPRDRARRGRRSLRSLLGGWRAALRARPALKSVEFDAGYFVLPDILGEAPPMRTTLVRKEGVLSVFEQLGGLVGDEYVAALRRRIAGRPVVVLMTSNFSEAGRMPLDHEISAYREFLAASGYAPDAVLVVKPHPRDDDAKIRRLGSAVGDLFSEVVLLTEAELFFIPFEICLMRALLPHDAEAGRGLDLVTFSTACLAPKLLFGVDPVIGFGEELVERFFHAEHVPGRIRHERDLRRAMRAMSNLS